MPKSRTSPTKDSSSTVRFTQTRRALLPPRGTQKVSTSSRKTTKAARRFRTDKRLATTGSLEATSTKRASKHASSTDATRTLPSARSRATSARRQLIRATRRSELETRIVLMIIQATSICSRAHLMLKFALLKLLLIGLLQASNTTKSSEVAQRNQLRKNASNPSLETASTISRTASAIVLETAATML